MTKKTMFEILRELVRNHDFLLDGEDEGMVISVARHEKQQIKAHVRTCHAIDPIMLNELINDVLAERGTTVEMRGAMAWFTKWRDNNV